MIVVTLECLKDCGKHSILRQEEKLLDIGLLNFESKILYRKPGILSIPGAPYGGLLTALEYSDSEISSIIYCVSKMD